MSLDIDHHQIHLSGESTLIQHVQKAQRFPSESKERRAALFELVDLILRARKIGRAPGHSQLSGVYLTIYNRIRMELLSLLDKSLDTIHPGPSVRQWAIVQLQQASCNGLDDDLLKALALEAQRHPPQTPDRLHALTELVEAIRISGRLIRPHRSKFTPQFYQLLYEEAVNQTLIYICRRIDTYDPDRGQAKRFMNWVNFRLDKILIECRRAFSDREIQELPDLNSLELIPQPEAESTLSDDIRDFIASDPELVFCNTHIRNRPEANFQAIALARFAETSWEEISEKFSLKIPTLSSFYQRCCKKFAPLFQEQFQHLL